MDFCLNFEFAFVHRRRRRAKGSSQQPFKVRQYLPAGSVRGADLRYATRTSCFSLLPLSVFLLEAGSKIHGGLKQIIIISEFTDYFCSFIYTYTTMYIVAINFDLVRKSSDNHTD